MENLTQYTDSELSMRVFNDEYFYSERENRDYLLALVAEEFEYTQAQMDELIDDLNNDVIEAINSQIESERPVWIEPVDVYDISAIQQGGCSSGAYMPAVTYSQAVKTMSEHGDDILQLIEDTTGDTMQVLSIPDNVNSWDELAVFYLSYAVELWAAQFDLDGVEL